ncbi:MAG: flagellar basal body-associated FliL family protein [Deltaproteobacteria bacterium]|nr:flagellar basal body-associated FliL family protein [Deltaproteobacteria bacterium]
MSIIIPLKSFVVNLFDKRGMGKRYLKISMELEVGKEEDRVKVENNIPQLREA